MLMKLLGRLLTAVALPVCTGAATAQVAADRQTAAPHIVPATPAAAVAETPACIHTAEGNLVAPSGTLVLVRLDDDLSTRFTNAGTPFSATVVADVTCDTAVVVPHGAKAHGVVTFSSERGAFGRAGILGLSLRNLALGNQTVALRGTYRESGKEPEAAMAVATVTVGLLSGLVTGRSSTVSRGRVLRARLGEDVAVPVAPSPTIVPPAPAP